MYKTIGCRLTCVLTIALMATACSQSPEERARKFVAAGKSYIAKKDYARAFLEFKNAAVAVPKDAEPPYQLALTYLALGDVDSGLSYLRKSVSLDPKHAEAQIKLSEVLATQGDPAVWSFEGLEGGEAQALPLPGSLVLERQSVAAARRFVQKLHQRREGGRVHVLQGGEVEHHPLGYLGTAAKGLPQDGHEELARVPIIAFAPPEEAQLVRTFDPLESERLVGEGFGGGHRTVQRW